MSRDNSSDALPFTQVDRAVKAKAAVLASAIGIHYQHALGSLIEFWDLNGGPREIEKLIAKDVHDVVLDAREVSLRFKIASGQDVDVQVLTRTGFLEPIGELYRVRGMSRYFKPVEKRLMRRKLGAIGGLASAESRRASHGTAKPGAVLLEQPASNPEPTPEAPPKQTGSKPEANVEAKFNLEDRGQRSESLKTTTAGESFFAWAQGERFTTLGLPEEPPPRAPVGTWFNEAMSKVGGDRSRLESAWRGYLGSRFWAVEADLNGCRWSMWVKHWREFVAPTSVPPPKADAVGEHQGFAARAVELPPTTDPLELGWRKRLSDLRGDQAYAATQLSQLRATRLDGHELVVTHADEFFVGWCRENYAALVPGVRLEHQVAP